MIIEKNNKPVARQSCRGSAKLSFPEFYILTTVHKAIHIRFCQLLYSAKISIPFFSLLIQQYIQSMMKIIQPLCSEFKTSHLMVPDHMWTIQVTFCNDI